MEAGLFYVMFGVCCDTDFYVLGKRRVNSLVWEGYETPH